MSTLGRARGPIGAQLQDQVHLLRLYRVASIWVESEADVRRECTGDRHRPLQHGLAAGTWVLLRCGDEWIDRRFLTVPWSRGTEAGVEFVVEPQTKLEAFLANREGPHTEFKRQVPTED